MTMRKSRTASSKAVVKHSPRNSLQTMQLTSTRVFSKTVRLGMVFFAVDHCFRLPYNGTTYYSIVSNSIAVWGGQSELSAASNMYNEKIKELSNVMSCFFALYTSTFFHRAPGTEFGNVHRRMFSTDVWRWYHWHNGMRLRTAVGFKMLRFIVKGRCGLFRALTNGEAMYEKGPYCENDSDCTARTPAVCDKAQTLCTMANLTTAAPSSTTFPTTHSSTGAFVDTGRRVNHLSN